MSTSQMRIQSAGCSRARSAKKTDWALRDSVIRLEEELNLTKSQLNSVTSQFETLVTLIKRAWNGNKEANINLAKLIGVASPDVEVENTNGKKFLKMKLKPPSINNWAKLTMGLLKKDAEKCNSESSEVIAHYLNERKKYMTEQMTCDNFQKRPLFRPRSSSSSDANRDRSSTINASSVGKILVRRPSFTHLYQSPPFQMNGTACDDVFDDAIIQQTANGNVEPCTDQMCRRRRGQWEGNRYVVGGLFEMEDMTGDLRLRPPSGVQQKSASELKSKPKSAGYSRGERPLKYETTRPVKVLSHKTKLRAQSAKAAAKPQVLEPSQITCVDENVTDEENIGETTEEKTNISPVSSDEEEVVEKIENPEITRLKNRLKKPDSVIAFDEDLGVMAKMEDEFRRKAIELQKKLGIDATGMVY